MSRKNVADLSHPKIIIMVFSTMIFHSYDKDTVWEWATIYCNSEPDSSLWFWWEDGMKRNGDNVTIDAILCE